MSTEIVLFTRDLRLRDNPGLAAAADRADHVVPLFVLDDRIIDGFSNPARQRFLADCLADLDRRLRRKGGNLVLRQGDVVTQVCAVAAEVNAATVHVAADVSGYARRREHRLRTALAAQRRELHCHEGAHTVIAPGSVTPAANDHYAVFTPFHRRWSDAPRRRVLAEPRRIVVPGIDPGRLPAADGAGPRGGETEARKRARRWLDQDCVDYVRTHDDLAGDRTSRLSPYLHFGCLSAAELADDALAVAGGEPFARQLAWRDFHHQVLAARPEAAHRDYRARGDRWRDDPQALQAWQEGQTGFPIVDAGMRQLRDEGWMHNRARMITASFLTKTLYLDWRAGAAHFAAHLLDADVANNCLNWQWVAGTGTDTRPNRVLNPLRQAERYDPAGDYVRKYVPELAGLEPDRIHLPWTLPPGERRRLGYPPPLVDLAEARGRFLLARNAGQGD